MAPSVTLVTGGSTNGDQLIISGSGFGTKSRSKPWIWADFQSGSTAPHSSLSFNTSWTTQNKTTVNDSNNRWGNGCARSNWNYTSAQRPTTFQVPAFNNTYNSKMALSWWVKSDIAYTGINWKFSLRIWKGPGATNYPDGIWGHHPVGGTESDILASMEDWTVTTGIDRKYYGTSFGYPNSTWRQETYFLKLNSALAAQDGTSIVKINNTTVHNSTNWRYNNTSRPDHITTPFIQHVIANANVISPQNVWNADIYADDSWNHVCIGNASTYAACTKLEFQPYTGWTATSISCSRRNGTISGSAWLYVLDDNLVANTSGYALGGIAPPAPPTITNISPSSGPVGGGTTITITGTTFAATPAVKVNAVDATGESFTNSTSMTAVTPAGTAGPKDVLLTNPDTSNVTAAGAFTYIAAPTFTSVTPATGLTTGGESVVIVGTGFNGSTVTFGGVAATDVVLTGSTTIDCTTPAGTAGAKDIVITNADTQAVTGTGAYTYSAPAGGSGTTQRRRTLLGLG